MSWFRRSSNPPKCRIDEEWGGLFIGRRWCATHQVRWDDGGICPAVRPSSFRQLVPGGALTADMPPYLAMPGTLVPFKTAEDGPEQDFVVLEIVHDGRTILTLQDRASYERQHRVFDLQETHSDYPK